MTKESWDHLRHWLIYIRSDSNPIGALYYIHTYIYFFSKGPCKWEWDDKVALAPIKWWIFSKNNIFTKNDIHTESNLVKVLAHNKLFFFFCWKYYSVQQNSTISTKHSPKIDRNCHHTTPTTTIIHKGAPQNQPEFCGLYWSWIVVCGLRKIGFCWIINEPKLCCTRVLISKSILSGLSRGLTRWMYLYFFL